MELRNYLGHTFSRNKKYVILEEAINAKLADAGENNFGYSFVMSMVDLLAYTNDMRLRNYKREEEETE